YLILYCVLTFFFFFQAEDGIRDRTVTGVQTCALPILNGRIQLFEIQKKYLHKDGHTVWAHVRSNLLRDGAGEPLYFVSHVQDITQRKQAEEALRQSEERYFRLVELSHDGILIHSQGRLLFLNPAAAKIIGANSPEEMI